MHGRGEHPRIGIARTFAEQKITGMKKLLFTLLFSGLSILLHAQCAVCTKTAASMDDSAARGLNGGIIYLAFMPLTLILFIGYRWYKSNRGQ